MSDIHEKESERKKKETCYERNSSLTTRDIARRKIPAKGKVFDSEPEVQKCTKNFNNILSPKATKILRWITMIRPK